MSGGDHTLAPEGSTCLAVVALPVALNDINGIEHLAVSPVDTPHANQRLELDHCPHSACVVKQCQPSLLICQPPQCHPPPALNDPSPEGCMLQCPAHQVATPPGLDLDGCLYLLFLDGDKRDCSGNFVSGLDSLS